VGDGDGGQVGSTSLLSLFASSSTQDSGVAVGVAVGDGDGAHVGSTSLLSLFASSSTQLSGPVSGVGVGSLPAELAAVLVGPALTGAPTWAPHANMRTIVTDTPASAFLSVAIENPRISCTLANPNYVRFRL
jgi:hypothetical protein